jgi:hypothetical protein
MSPYRRASIVHRALLGLICVAVVSGCGGAGGAAGQRFKDAVRIIATRTATAADDVESALRSKFPTLNEAQLAEEAEAAARRTTWVDSLIARVAAERAKTARAVHRSTCKLIESWDFLVDLSEADQASEVEAIIVNELRTQGLPENEKTVLDVFSGIANQFESVQATGTLDLQSMYSDLFCLLEP